MAIANTILPQAEETLELYLVKKAPFQIPEGGKKFIVNYGPWIMLVFLVLGAIAIVSALGILAVATPFATAGGYNTNGLWIVRIAVSIASLVLEALALPGLFKKKKSGWNLLYYSVWVSALSSLISFNIFALVLGTLISFYILFQVRDHYVK